MATTLDLPRLFGRQAPAAGRQCDTCDMVNLSDAFEGVGADFVVHIDRALRVAVIHVLADHNAMDPPRRSRLLQGLRRARDELRDAGFDVACQPPIVAPAPLVPA
jgi:hypothetical protein